MIRLNPDGSASAHDTPGSTDLLGRPSTAFFWWGLPFLVGFGTNFLPIPPTARILVWAAALAWMGAGCTLNALRCQRLHCYISAPVLFLGAAAAPVLAFGLTPLPATAASYVINVSLVLMVMSLGVEPVLGKYRSRSQHARK
jgi:hypothetical protein